MPARDLSINQLRLAGAGTVIMFGNNFGFFDSSSRAGRLLRDLHRITEHSGDLH